MKDYTTPEYIAPIINEIEKHFFIDQAPKNAFLININIILTAADEPGPGRTCFLIGPENAGNIPTTAALLNLYNKIDEYTEAVETYPGELHNWSKSEKDRATLAAGTALIKKYSGPGPRHNNGPLKF